MIGFDRNARRRPTVYAAHSSLNLATVRYRIITAGTYMITVAIGAPQPGAYVGRSRPHDRVGRSAHEPVGAGRDQAQDRSDLPLRRSCGCPSFHSGPQEHRKGAADAVLTLPGSTGGLQHLQRHALEGSKDAEGLKRLSLPYFIQRDEARSQPDVLLPERLRLESKSKCVDKRPREDFV
jgi:hypothetical protein